MLTFMRAGIGFYNTHARGIDCSHTAKFSYLFEGEALRAHPLQNYNIQLRTQVSQLSLYVQ